MLPSVLPSVLSSLISPQLAYVYASEGRLRYDSQWSRSAIDDCSHGSLAHASSRYAHRSFRHDWQHGSFVQFETSLPFVTTTAHPLMDHALGTQWRRLLPTVPNGDSPWLLLLGVLKLCNLLAFLLANLQSDRKRMLSSTMAMLLLLPHSFVPAAQASPTVVREARVASTDSRDFDYAVIANMPDGQFPSWPLLQAHRRGSAVASSHSTSEVWHAPSAPSPHQRAISLSPLRAPQSAPCLRLQPVAACTRLPR